MNYYEQFEKELYKYNTAACIEIVKDMSENNYDINEIYTSVIMKALERIGLPDENGKFDIASEHIFSEIIRTVLENLYTCVESKENVGKSVIVSGLENELHTIGARIVFDYFRLAGYDSYFLGVNIPNENIVDAIKRVNADYIAISVMNFYNIPTLQKLVKLVREHTDCKIIVGGIAVKNNKEFIQTLGVDVIIDNCDEIKGVDNNETSI